jgi:cell division protein FtsB
MLDIPQFENEGSIIATVVLVVVAFFFGKSGVVTRFMDGRLRNIEANQNREQRMIDSYVAENDELRKRVSTLSERVYELEQELAIYKEKMNVLEAYFEKINPTPDAFFDKIKTPVVRAKKSTNK